MGRVGALPLSADLAERLAAAAVMLGVSVGEVVRRAVGACR